MSNDRNAREEERYDPIPPPQVEVMLNDENRGRTDAERFAARSHIHMVSEMYGRQVMNDEALVALLSSNPPANFDVVWDGRAYVPTTFAAGRKREENRTRILGALENIRRLSEKATRRERRSAFHALDDALRERATDPDIRLNKTVTRFDYPVNTMGLEESVLFDDLMKVLSIDFPPFKWFPKPARRTRSGAETSNANAPDAADVFIHLLSSQQIRAVMWLMDNRRFDSMEMTAIMLIASNFGMLPVVATAAKRCPNFDVRWRFDETRGPQPIRQLTAVTDPTIESFPVMWAMRGLCGMLGTIPGRPEAARQPPNGFRLTAYEIVHFAFNIAQFAQILPRMGGVWDRRMEAVMKSMRALEGGSVVTIPTDAPANQNQNEWVVAIPAAAGAGMAG